MRKNYYFVIPAPDVISGDKPNEESPYLLAVILSLRRIPLRSFGRVLPQDDTGGAPQDPDFIGMTI